MALNYSLSSVPWLTLSLTLAITTDGKPGLDDFVACVTASTALGMTKGWLGERPSILVVILSEAERNRRISRSRCTHGFELSLFHPFLG